MYEGFVGGGKREMDEAPHLARFLLLHKVQWIKPFHLGCEGNGEARRIEAGDGSHSALAGKQVGPDFGRGSTYSTQQPDACNDHPSCHLANSLTAFRVLLDVFGRVLYCLNLFRIFVRNFQVKGFLELHNQFDYVERVCSQIFLKRCTGGHFSFIDLKLLDDYLFYLLFHCCCCHAVLLSIKTTRYSVLTMGLSGEDASHRALFKKSRLGEAGLGTVNRETALQGQNPARLGERSGKAVRRSFRFSSR